MSLRWIAALTAFGLVVAAHAADKKKLDYAPETGPQPRQCPMPAPLTLPSPHCLEAQVPQYFPAEPSFPLLNELHYQVEIKTPAPQKARAVERSMMKTYAVADLVIPVPPAGKALVGKPETQERLLIRKIKCSVTPDCWDALGGDCSMEYFPLGMALVVNAPPTVHESICKYLDGLRQIQDTQFQVKVVLATVTAKGLEQMGLARDFGPNKASEIRSRVKFLATDELPAFEQFKAECVTLSAPTITVLNGQDGGVQVGQIEHFLTGVDVRVADGGSIVFSPKNEPHHLGVDVKVRPNLSADGKFVKLAVAAQARDVTRRPVGLIPISTKIKPVFENGAQGAEVPFTQFLQDPRIVTRSVDETVTLPDGGTVVFYGGPATTEETVQERAAVFADFPFLNELMVREKKVSSTNHLLVFATTRVIKAAECDECVQCSFGNSKLVKLMTEYTRACRDGHTDEARRLAMECLVIDPTCFGKK